MARRHLISAGLTERVIDRRIAERYLHPIHAGVYAVGHQRLLPYARVMAAVLACGDDSAASHRTSGWVQGMQGAPSGPIDVTIPRGGGRRRSGIRVHTTRHPIETTVVEGIPCTTPMRTLVDLATVLNERQLKRTLERTLELDVFDRIALDAVLAHSKGRRGMKLLRRLVAELPEELPPTAIEIERRLLELIKKAGLAYPVVNAYVGIYQVDFHWPEFKLVVETDGKGTHGHAIAFHRDRDRDLYLEERGWRVIRLTWRQIVNEPERVMAVLRRHLR